MNKNKIKSLIYSKLTKVIYKKLILFLSLFEKNNISSGLSL